MGEYKGYILEEGEIEPGKYGVLIYSNVEDWRNRNPADTAWDEADAKRKVDEGKVSGKSQLGEPAGGGKRSIKVSDYTLEDFISLADYAGDQELYDFLEQRYAHRHRDPITELLGGLTFEIPDTLYDRLLVLIDRKAAVAAPMSTRRKYQEIKRNLEERGSTY